jgi:hypothetical protein
MSRMTTTYPLRTVVFRYSLICCQCLVFDTCLSLYLQRVDPLKDSIKSRMDVDHFH